MTSTQTRHDDDRQPTWMVQSVFDPDGELTDFAYTIGLHDLGHPELHLFAGPSLGDDPGHDWALSPGDRGRILNELAWELIDGRLPVGSERTRVCDGGDAVVTMRLDPPGDVEELEAYGVDPGAVVLPLRWSLTRPPEGRAVALTPSARETARQARREILSTVNARAVVAPRGWSLQGRAVWGRDQRYGPLTPVVRARAAQLWQADTTGLSRLLRNALDVDTATSLTLPVTLGITAGRRAGRRQQLVDLRGDVADLVRQLTQDGWWRRRWHDLNLSLWGSETMGDPESAHRATRSTASLLEEVATSCLIAEAVSDVLDPGVLVHARGAWTDALEPLGDVPRERQAARVVIDVVTDLLRPLSAQQLCGVVHVHRSVRDGRAEEHGDYAAVASRLRGLALTGPAGCPWVGALDVLPAWAGVIPVWARGRDVTIAPVPDLQEWASLVTSALCHRGLLSAADVEALASPFRVVVPQLAHVLNQPVVR